MHVPRACHRLTALTDGRVLVTGGMGPAGYTDSAEVFDPATGEFTATGAMHAARACHTATLLPNGLVLVAGGLNGGYEASAFFTQALMVHRWRRRGPTTWRCC